MKNNRIPSQHSNTFQRTQYNITWQTQHPKALIGNMSRCIWF